ncbi:MAG TPA: aldehyde dehydrogenase, partial [Acidobacteriota bacterium]|nr:aldehyde dehydrogenase [Acidobacteriota bacterium]
NVILSKTTNEDEVKNAFRKAAESGPLKGVMGVLEGEYASSRIVGDSHSSIVDLPLMQILDGNLLSIAAWYDNEMGYATRLAESAARLAQS